MMPIFSFGDLPPEIQEKIKAQHEHQEMHSEAEAHDAYRTIEEMTCEQLIFLKSLILNVSGHDGATGHYFVGYITALLYAWYGLCPVDGLDHDEELEKVVMQNDGSDGTE